MTRKTSRRTPPDAKAITAYSMPTVSPLYPMPPFEYRDGWSQLLLFRSDPEIIARHVPAPLSVDPDGGMSMMISRFFASGFGSYHEATLCATVRFRNKPINFALYLILDNDIAVCAGREIWGWPKKMGRVTLADRDGVVTSSVERGGLPLVQAAVEVGPLVAPAALSGANMEFITLKLIPSVRNGAPPDVMQLAKTALTNLVPKQVYRGRGTLAFGASPVDGLAVFPVREVVDAFWFNSDFTLGDGEVVHDYLA